MKTLSPTDAQLLNSATLSLQMAAHHREQVMKHIVEVYELNQGDRILPSGQIVSSVEERVRAGVDQLLENDLPRPVEEHPYRDGGATGPSD